MGKSSRFPQDETRKFGQGEVGAKTGIFFSLLATTFPHRSVQVCRQKDRSRAWIYQTQLRHDIVFSLALCLNPPPAPWSVAGSSLSLIMSSVSSQPEKLMSAEQVIPTNSAEFWSCKNLQHLENTTPITAGEGQHKETNNSKNRRRFWWFLSNINNFPICKCLERVRENLHPAFVMECSTELWNIKCLTCTSDA